MGVFNDFYEILGIDPHATRDEIKHAYRQRARESHPDLHPDDNGEQTEEMRLVNEAYQTLSDSRRRSAYDVEWKAYYRQRGALKKAEPDVVEQVRARPPATGNLRQDEVLLWILIVLIAILAAGIAIRIGYRIAHREQGGPRLRPVADLPSDAPISAPDMPMMSADTPPPRPEDRLAELEQYIETDPDDLQAMFESSRILFDLGRFDESLAWVESGLERVEEIKADEGRGAEIIGMAIGMEGGFLMTGYQVCKELGRLDEARGYLVRLIEVSSEERRQGLQDALRELDASIGGGSKEG